MSRRQAAEKREIQPDAKFNDVVLTMCAGALRRYFDALDEEPDAPIVAMEGPTT